MHATVTVIIPVYNGERFIRDAVESVLSQTKSCQELIVVDDASTDGTARIVSELAATAPGIRLLSIEKNSGPSKCRNTAASMASGEWLAFLDADDRWDNDHLEVLLLLAAKYPEASVLTAMAHSGSRQVRTTENTTFYQSSDALIALLHDNFITQSACMVRREAFRSTGGYRSDMRYGEDYQLWMRLALNGAAMALSTQQTCLRRRHDNQVSERQAVEMTRSEWTTIKSTIDFLESSSSSSHRLILFRARQMLPARAATSCRMSLSNRRRDLLSASINAVRWTGIARWRLFFWHMIAGPLWPVVRWLLQRYDRFRRKGFVTLSSVDPI